MNMREFDFMVYIMPWFLGFIAAMGIAGVVGVFAKFCGELIAGALRYLRWAREPYSGRRRGRAGAVRLRWRRREDYIRTIGRR